MQPTLRPKVNHVACSRRTVGVYRSPDDARETRHPRPGRLSRLSLLLFAIPVAAPAQAPTFTYEIVHRYPHNPASYTEGLFFLNGLMYEGTGLEGHSGIAVYPLGSTTPTRRTTLPPEFFGEGIIHNGSTLLQWTWQSHAGFIYNRRTLQQVGTFSYTGEGWGITRTARELITSDGTATLRFRNPANFAETRHITVHDGPTPIDQLNELEDIHGIIYANIWHSDRIAEISPADGHVLAWIDCTGLFPAAERRNPEAVLNGIAFDAKRNRLFVTGKQWPTIFEIKTIPQHP